MQRVLDRRSLNRATLERQLLLRRAELTPEAAIEHLGGMQAQVAGAPSVGLWSRLDPFDRDALTRLIDDRRVVRGSLLRGTQHFATADDYCWLRPLVQPALDRQRQASFGRDTAGIDLDELAAAARELLTGTTLTRPEIARRLAERWPGRDPLAFGWSAQALLALVHPPPFKGGATPFVLAEEWLGRPLDAAPPVQRLIVRHLAAFGPATLMDVQAWSGLTRLREVVDRSALVTFRDEDGRELLDLPDAPRPDPETPAPVRFLPEFDNLLMAFADRTRIIDDAARARVISGSLVRPTILVDGEVRATWALKDGELTIEPFGPLPDAVHEEGERLLAFVAAG